MTAKPTKLLSPNPTIGVFDSGFGGLTVLRDLLPLIPGARYIYLGDTARLPYGSKSRETIARYAVSSAKFLEDQGADLLCIACNTASALALEDIQQAMPIPVVGVIQPGAEAALAAKSSASQQIVSEQNCHPERSAAESKDLSFSPEPPQASVLVLATTATTQSHAYAQSLNALGLAATEKACPLLVPLVEEGWIDHHVTAEVLRIYLNEAFAEAPNAQTLLLGCTHYPLLQPLIERTLAELNHPMTIIDSAAATAASVAAYFLPNSTGAPATSRFYATDSIEKFQRLGSAFLNQLLSEVHLLDLGG
ncbi:MAG TPA: aspartate/glutamate racemase family protein [Edaphobacter sp.]|uniref:glutamate racemase n=1 Tax=Edaphobacter sp. TaxID=1934404 RepID=UPI002BED499B|nr:aspartate/glutamate racemase family protein [Edaphobacter sp.]HUZ94940.1 aspartate/glutamate racemase family protein [Edaphobacter sp.]